MQLSLNTTTLYTAQSKLPPHDARKESNKLTASFNIWAKSKKDKVYPELKVGDEVKSHANQK